MAQNHPQKVAMPLDKQKSVNLIAFNPHTKKNLIKLNKKNVEKVTN